MYLRTPSQRLLRAASQVNWPRVLIVALAAFVLIGLAVATAGCQLKEPIDTDGDGRPDTSMTADQIDLWQKRDEAKVKAAVEKAKAEAEARIAQQKAALEEAKRIKRDAEREIRKAHAKAESDSEEIAADAEDQIAALEAQVDVAIQNIQADASASIAKLAEDLQTRNDARTIALSNIEANAGFIQDVMNSGAVKAAAGAIPFGNDILGMLGIGGSAGLLHWLGRRGGKQAGQAAGETKGWDDGYAAGLAHGKEVGKSEGRDIGWQERADHQKEIDATHDAALALANIAKGGGVIG
jgi:hypothetical protein